MFRAEDFASSRQNPLTSQNCFNGAALVQSGRPDRSCAAMSASLSFNGAALVQSGRLGGVVNRQRLNAAGFNGAALVQSGRRHHRAEVVLALGLQWGRSCSERKTQRDGAGAVDVDRLQWGRSCSERKTDRIAAALALVQMLQWGRSCSERKTRSSLSPMSRCERGFNGAALVQSGRPRFRKSTRQTNGWLQWGRSCSERKTIAADSPERSPLMLQWGRSCSERKTQREH